MNHHLITLAAGLALAGCTQGDAPVDNDIVETPMNETQSIFRDEVRNEIDDTLVEEEGPLRLTVGFPEGGSELDDAALQALDGFVLANVVDSDEPVRLTGHSDTVGSDEDNFRAGEERAQAVADYMIEKGVAEERITIITLGEGNPVEPNYLPDGSDNEPGQRANRRVDIMVGEMPEPAGPADDPIDGSQPTT